MYFNIAYLIFGITLAAYAAPVTNDVSSNPIPSPASVVIRTRGFKPNQRTQYQYTANGRDRKDSKGPANPKVNAAVEKALESFGVFEPEALNDFAGLKTLDQEIPFKVISDVESSTTGLHCPCEGTVRILREAGELLFVMGKLTSIRIGTYTGLLDVTKDVREKMIAEEALNTKTIRVLFPYKPA